MSTRKRNHPKRVKLACSNCNRRKVRCDGKIPCNNCIVRSQTCVPFKPMAKKQKRIGTTCLSDKNNKHKGEQCYRKKTCLRPNYHPGHCRIIIQDCRNYSKFPNKSNSSSPSPSSKEKN